MALASCLGGSVHAMLCKYTLSNKIAVVEGRHHMGPGQFRKVEVRSTFNAVEDSSNVLFPFVWEAALIVPLILKLTHLQRTRLSNGTLVAELGHDIRVISVI